MAENNNNQKEVLLKVTSDTSEVNSGLDVVKQKIQQANESARELSKVDYGSMSVRELKEELDKAEMSMEQLEASGQATADAMRVVGSRVDEISGALKGIQGQRSFETFKGSIMASTGAVEALEGAMVALGFENEEFEKTIQRLMGIRAFKDGIEDVFEYGKSMQGLIQNTNGAVSATKVLKVGLAGLGIGLLITAVSYLIENWDSFRKTIMDTFPELNGLSKWFTNIKPIMMGVGNAVVQFVIQPIRSLVNAIKALTQGEFKKAGESLIDVFNPVKRYKDVVAGFKKGYADEIVRANAEKDKKVETSVKKRVEATNKAVDKAVEAEKKSMEELSRYIAEAEREILKSKTEAREFDLMDVRNKYAERIKLAQSLGQDITALVEAQRLAEKEVNDRYDKVELDNATKLAKEKLDAEKKAKEDAVSSATLQGDTNVLNAETGDDGSVASVNRITEARLEALRMRYEAEQALYAEDKDKMANITARYESDKAKAEEEGSEARTKIAEAEKEAKLNTYDAVGAGLGALSALAGESTVVGKALGVASAVIDTYVGANKALAQGGFAGIAMATAVIATGLLNVKKILSTKVEGAKGGSAPSVAGVSTAGVSNAPVINTQILNRGETEDLNSLNGNSSNTQTVSPIRAYIVDRDIEKSKEKNELTDKLSTF